VIQEDRHDRQFFSAIEPQEEAIETGIRFPIDASEVITRDVVPKVGKLDRRAVAGRAARTGGRTS